MELSVRLWNDKSAPRGVMNEQISKAASLRASGLGIDEIARVMRVHRRTVFKWLEVAGPVAVENPVEPISRNRAAIQKASLELVALAIDRLRAINPSPAQIATVLAKLTKIVNALPAPPERENDGSVSLEQLRAELSEKLDKLKAMSPPPSTGE
jgi:hypothetical protein